MDARPDILNLEHFSNPTRDRQAATLVCNYLRYMGYDVVEECSFRGFHFINKLKPKLLFVSNSVGAPISPQLLRYATMKGIPCVSLVSEGNFKQDSSVLQLQFWGWNTDRVLHEKIQLLWSKRALNLIVHHEPHLTNQLRVSGAVNFDMYTIRPFLSRQAFLEKYGKSEYGKVIGIGCWNFGRHFPGDPKYRATLKHYGQDQIARFQQDASSFANLLRQLAKEHPDILFLCKLHPMVRNRNRVKASGLEGLETYPNALFVSNEESIGQCLAVSDLWGCYESTTALEAWLLDIPTFLINPSGPDFPRNIIYEGSPVFETLPQLHDAITSYYRQGTFPNFIELEAIRNRIIPNVTEWVDGLNHVRAGNEVIRILRKASPVLPRNDTLTQFKTRWIREAAMFMIPRSLEFIPKLAGICGVKKNFSKSQLDHYAEGLLNKQIAYYGQIGFDQDRLASIHSEA